MLLNRTTSTMGTSVKLVKTAADVWRSLNGIVCIYKPSGASMKKCRMEFQQKISQDFCRMPDRAVETIVDVRRAVKDVQPEKELEFGQRVVKRIDNGDDTIEILVGPNYNDNPLAIGARYQPEDIKLMFASYLGRDTSGIAVCGLNKGTNVCYKIRESRWLRSYVVSGKFGIATDTHFHTGRIGAKSTFKNIRRHMLDRLLSTLQATHQQLAFEAMGVPSTSQRAYEIASQGLVRPAENSDTVVYSLKCTDFELPNFEIEIQTINETEDFLKTIIHEIGIKLHSFAVCTKLRCIRYGPFSVEDALLRKHWDLQNVVDNMTANSDKLKNINLNVRAVLVDKY